MSKKSKKKGISGAATSAIISLAMIGLALAFLKMSGVSNIEEGSSYIKDKTSHYMNCIPDGTCGIVAVVNDIEVPDGNTNLKLELPEVGEGFKLDADKGGFNLDSNGGMNFEGLTIDRETKGYRGPSKSEPYVNNAGLVVKEAVEEMSDKLTIVSDDIKGDKDEAEDKVEEDKYSVKDWTHWAGTEGRSCWNTRKEILNRDAEPGTVKYIDKEKKVTEDYDKACAIGIPKDEKGRITIDYTDSGAWICPYSGKKITEVDDMAVDHVIPLEIAAKNGGQKWTSEQKKIFANDSDNLLATSLKEHEYKENEGPGEYMPPLKSYRCNYAKTYTAVAYKYDLTISEVDKSVLDKTLESCNY